MYFTVSLKGKYKAHCYGMTCDKLNIDRAGNKVNESNLHFAYLLVKALRMIK